MGGSRSPGRKLVVKHTFLEVIPQLDQNATEGRKRSLTEGAIVDTGHWHSETHNVSNTDVQAQTHQGSQHMEPDSHIGGFFQRDAGTLQNMHQAYQRSELETDGFHQKAHTHTEALWQTRIVQENQRLSLENAQLRAIQEQTGFHRPNETTQFGMAEQPTSYGAWAAQNTWTAEGAPVPVPMLPSCGPALCLMPMLATSSRDASQTVYNQPQSNGRRRKNGRAKADAPPANAVPSQWEHLPRRQPATHSTMAKQPAMLSLSDSISPNERDTAEYTTVMLRNLPNQYTRDMLCELLHEEGFARFNFVYLPVDFKTHAGLGYAFVDLTTPQEAVRAQAHFDGFCRWVVQSDKICSVSWSHKEQQGVKAHVERYRDSPVMHESVPEAWRPAIFSAGVRVPFPPPTRKIKNPRVRMPGQMPDQHRWSVPR